MTYFYPLYIRLEGRKCLVVGAGSVALRKIHDLLDGKAEITVISRAAHHGVLELAEQGAIKLILRPYQKEDLEKGGYYIVIGATNDEKLHLSIYKTAEKRHILCNIVDDLDYCNFIVPSIVRRGELSIGISTDGQTPFLSRAIMVYLEGVIGPEWGELVEFGKILRSRNKHGQASKEERAIFTDFWASPLGMEIQSGNREDAMKFIRKYIKEKGTEA